MAVLPAEVGQFCAAEDNVGSHGLVPVTEYPVSEGGGSKAESLVETQDSPKPSTATHGRAADVSQGVS
jgi:hypothetical protein